MLVSLPQHSWHSPSQQVPRATESVRQVPPVSRVVVQRPSLQAASWQTAGSGHVLVSAPQHSRHDPLQHSRPPAQAFAAEQGEQVLLTQRGVGLAQAPSVQQLPLLHCPSQQTLPAPHWPSLLHRVQVLVIQIGLLASVH